LLTDKLSPLVVERGFNSFLDYYYLLKYDTGAEQEWKRVMDALSVPETFFWREMDQVRALVNVIVPQYFSSPGVKPLRIWSAACATGEEPLSIAMALNEEGWFDRAPIEIYASDASEAAIGRARRGIYRERSFRSLPPKLREKYFSEIQGGWRIAPSLHAKVRWATANLMDEGDVAAFATAPVIFCRNVFIYFSDETIRKTVRMFAERMPTPGYLFVAASESLLRLTTQVQFQEIGGAFVYVKG
ncbi:MAG TPA: protein-glutamate O-methyltransferase CheR, partial [Blastocatellia bacterium]|nr:protein-glutamate O-methyltransferase CheR [Blastocatellia bacterium]